MQMGGLLCGTTPVIRDWLECALADACVESQTGGAVPEPCATDSLD